VIDAFYGQDPVSKQWFCPMRERWGLHAHQAMTPVLEEKLCFTAVKTGSFEAAAEVAGKWGTQTDDATVHQHVQQTGERAEQAEQKRVERALSSKTCGEVVAEAKSCLPSQPFVLVIMMDGWMGRHRGPDWGMTPRDKAGARVEWREVKSGIIYRLDQRAQTQGGRGMILKKYYAAWCGDPHEFGRRLYAEALRRGLNQAQKVYVIADGAVWIWNIVRDRFSSAVEQVDFYHVSEHLWTVARELYGEDEAAARRWVRPLLKKLKTGKQKEVVSKLQRLLVDSRRQQSPCAPVVEREAGYFQNHQERMNYSQALQEGRPIGSGAMESTCSQFQNRFKRTGQFWSPSGQNHLLRLEVARRNDDWDELWELAA
jgi:hypothetical protein